MEIKRFLYELPAIIANAKEGDQFACFNIISYYTVMVRSNETPRSEVAEYLISALSNLSNSEKARVAKGLKISTKEATPVKVLELLPQMTNMGIIRLIEKLTAVRGRTPVAHESGQRIRGQKSKKRAFTEINKLKIGAEVAKLHAKYKDRNSRYYDETKHLGLEPKKRSVTEVARKHSSSRAQIVRMHTLYKEYREYGCIDEDGNFIITKNNPNHVGKIYKTMSI